MNPALFRKLVELKLIASGTEVEVQYETIKENGKVAKNKGLFNVKRMYAHPFAFNTVVVIENKEGLEIETDFLAIKKVAGLDAMMTRQNDVVANLRCALKQTRSTTTKKTTTSMRMTNETRNHNHICPSR